MSDFREEMADLYGDDLLFLDPPEQFDNCILGMVERCGMSPVVLYDEAKVVKTLVDQGLGEDEAFDFYLFNVAGASAGERSPMFFTPRITDTTSSAAQG